MKPNQQIMYKVFSIRAGDKRLWSYNVQRTYSEAKPNKDECGIIYNRVRWNVAPTFDGIETKLFCFKELKDIPQSMREDTSNRFFKVLAEDVERLSFYLIPTKQVYRITYYWKTKTTELSSANDPEYDIRLKFPNTYLAKRVKLLKEIHVDCNYNFIT